MGKPACVRPRQCTSPASSSRSISTSRASGSRSAGRRPQPTSTCDAPRAAERSSCRLWRKALRRSEEHTSELQSLMRISYAVFCLKKKKKHDQTKKQVIRYKKNKEKDKSNRK